MVRAETDLEDTVKVAVVMDLPKGSQVLVRLWVRCTELAKEQSGWIQAPYSAVALELEHLMPRLMA